MSKGIPISSKKKASVQLARGVNPAISACFFCGETKNEMALMGKLKGDAKAPHNVVLDYVPCKRCREKFSRGVLMLGVTNEPLPDNRPPIQGGFYPTGAYMVATDDFVARLFGNEGKAAIEARTCLIDHGVLFALQTEYERMREENKE